MTSPAAQAVGRDRWLILAVLFVARASMGFQFQSIASVSAALVREMGFSYAEIGTLIAGLGRDVTASAATPVVIGGAFFALGVLVLGLFRALQSRPAK